MQEFETNQGICKKISNLKQIQLFEKIHSKK